MWTDGYDEAISRFSQFCGRRIRAINSATVQLSLKDGWNWSNLRQTDKPGKPHTLVTNTVWCNTKPRRMSQHLAFSVDLNAPLKLFGLLRQTMYVCLPLTHYYTFPLQQFRTIRPPYFIKASTLETRCSCIWYNAKNKYWWLL